MMKFLSAILIGILLLMAAGCSEDRLTDASADVSIDAKFPCSGGLAAEKYSCKNIDLVAHLSPEELQGEALNDIWGWTDPRSGKEYALVGLTDGVSFVDISTPSEPVVIGKLKETASVSKESGSPAGWPSLHHDDHEGKSSWRDFKVYKEHLFVVSDAQPHGMQVFDLTRLRTVKDPPVSFTEDYLYDRFANAHNIAINQETGFAYVAGSNTFGGGLHMVDIKDPLNPRFAGFHSDSTVGRDSTGYVHDTQCVNYRGPDPDYQGEEICMNASETHLSIVNVTDKEAPGTIANASYPGVRYAHQGWLTEDHRYFLLDDELDERHDHGPTRTYLFDVRDLDKPVLTGTYESGLHSIDHNQFVKGERLYQANYTTGLRILNLRDIEEGRLEEVAHFDTFPANDEAIFNGAWSNFPYFESGLIVVSDISNGLFILHPTP